MEEKELYYVRNAETADSANWLKSHLWKFIDKYFFKTSPNCLSKWRIFLLRKFGAKIGVGCYIAPSVTITRPWDFEMGNVSAIDELAFINPPVKIGDFVSVGNNVHIIAGGHDVRSRGFERTPSPITLGNGSFIGAGTFIGGGIKVGQMAVISAHSHITRDVPANSVTICAPTDVISVPRLPEEEYKNYRYTYNGVGGIKVDVPEVAIAYSHKETPTGSTTLKSCTLEELNILFREVFATSTDTPESMVYKQTEGWDSVGHMQLVVAIEGHFGISLKPEDFLGMRSFTQAQDILGKYGINFGVRKTTSIPEKFFDFSQYSERIAVQTADTAYTYAQMDQKSSELAGIVKKHKLTFLLAKNTIGSVACYVGCIKNQVPVAVLDAHKDVDFIGGIINQYHPEYLMLPTELVGSYTGEAVGIIDDYTILHIENTSYPVSDDLCLLLTTSGSTGSPKFVRLTEKNIQSNAISIAKYLELTENERPITSLPMYYSYGISIINSHFVVGATLILTETSVVEPDFWSLAKDQHVTSVSGVPYTYDMFRQMRVMDMDIPSLKTFTQAGGKMSKENVAFFAEKCKQKGRKLIVMYGQTEAAPRISYLPFEKAIEKSDSMGVPIPGVKLSVSEDGELICEGANVFQGYAESYLDLSKGDEIHGVLHTGDMACLDEDGYFYITGRKKRFVKVYGNRVGLDELEQLVAQKYGKVVCVGVDDHVTIYTDSQYVDTTQIAEFVSEQTKINMAAFKAVYIESFPYSDTGKVLYKKLEIIK